MRNYIILNNKKSDTISGLIIQELPPISKPAQRTQIETIDGRDGDIVTPLGYAAYDKTFTIGLYGTFNINEIIAYFATQGQVIFSNEPNKYYNYQIVDQIDYERLVRYRVATVTMHVQPFKYSATEGTITVDASDTVSGEGSDIALDGTAEAPFNVLRHKGNATQKTLSGKNLLPSINTTRTRNGVTFTHNDDGTISLSGTATADTAYPINVNSTGNARNVPLSAGNYILSGGAETSLTTFFMQAYYGTTGGADQYTTGAFTLSADGTMGAYIYVKSGTNTNGKTVYPMVESGSTATDYEEFCGGIPSPSPDYPQDIQVLTGESTVKIEGKNLLNANRTLGTPSDTTWANSTKRTFNFDDYIVGITRNNYYSGAPAATVVEDNGSYTVTALQGGYGVGLPIKIRPNVTYTLSASVSDAANAVLGVTYYKNDGTYISYENAATPAKFTFTPPTNTGFAIIQLSSITNLTCKYSNIQLELGSTATTYEPYKGQSYVIPFGDTYLAKIGDYADEPVKVDGTWYIRRAIGKVVLDGTEIGWVKGSTGGANDVYIIEVPDAVEPMAAQLAYCDYFTWNNNIYDAAIKGFIFTKKSNNIQAVRFGVGLNNLSTLPAWTTWLSTHNVAVYYVLATPTDEAITDQDLIDALDAFYDQAHAYKGQTNIRASAADGNAPAVLSVDVNEDNESTVTNAGNTTSRPILTIYGQGNIGVYINDVEVLTVALGDEGYITLDSVEMEAYKDTTANLKNRLVTGDYSKLALNAGANKIRFTGIVTKYEISKYSRWL